MLDEAAVTKTGLQIYTLEERIRRDNTPWTTVQGVLAPVQFLIFLVSLFLVARYLILGSGYEIATMSIILKTIVLYVIMFTGAIWEKVVFGQYLLAPSFFWEDIVSFFVIAVHSAYLVALIGNLVSDESKMLIALAAYILYVINALQFLIKFRMSKSSKNLRANTSAGLTV
jgi:3-vinyl bacteriochlorophyllide hydratase